MVDTILYILFSICHLILFILSIRFIYKEKTYTYVLFLPLVITGLFYDNLIISLGTFISEGKTLYLLSIFRFWFHALFTPTLLLFGYALAKQANILSANKKYLNFYFRQVH